MNIVNPKCIGLLSVGIADYKGSNFSCIPCAVLDAAETYQILIRTLSAKIDPSRAILLKDATAHEFSSCFRILSRNIGVDDLLIIYFSGHGRKSKDVFELVFSDAKFSEGFLSSKEIAELIRKCGNPHTLLVLDCCSSGLATDISKAGEKFFPSRTSLLAASRATQSAQSGVNGVNLSYFTTRLLQVFAKRNQVRKEMRFSELFSEIFGKCDTAQKPTFSLPEGVSDIVLRDSREILDSDKSFSKEFCRTVNSSPANDRETLWYSLAELKESDAIGVFTEWKNGHSRGEALWKVRRAIGSALAKVKELSAERNDLCIEAFRTGELVWETVALIGCRNAIDDRKVSEMFSAAITKSDTIDAQWLAFLYLADAIGERILQIPEIRSCNLLKSGWGVCEMFEAVASKTPIDQHNNIYIEIAKMCDEHHANTLNDYIKLSHPELNPQSARRYSSSLKRLSRTGNRGALKINGVPKWVYSKMFGSWRGHISGADGGVLEALRKKEVITLIRDVERAPSIRVKLGMFELLQRMGTSSAEYRTHILWALTDDHPWVRRAFLEWADAMFNVLSEKYRYNIVETVSLHCDSNVMPGGLDIIFEYARFQSRLKSRSAITRRLRAAINERPIVEQRSILHAVDQERIRMD